MRSGFSTFVLSHRQRVHQRSGKNGADAGNKHHAHKAEDPAPFLGNQIQPVKREADSHQN